MRHPPTLSRRLRIAAALALVALLAPAPALAFKMNFAARTILIPAQVEYQPGDTNADGTVAAYGLVYTVLAKNKARVTAGQRPITIYWVVHPQKLSHHRCWAADDVAPSYASPNDNDGCDLSIPDTNTTDAQLAETAGQPVALLDPSFAEVVPFTANGISYDSSTGDISRSGSFAVNPAKKRVKYSGGVWVVDSTDFAAFTDLLTNDPAFAHFHKDGTGSRHYVNLHVARAGFSADVARAMNEKPPIIAVVGNGPRNILESYLDRAGINDLNFPTREGNTTVHGTVYDILDPLIDFVSTAAHPCGAINANASAGEPDTGCADPIAAPDYKTFYSVLWAADWKIDSGSKYPPSWAGNAAGAKANALANIGTFVDRGNGLFAEDSSIITLEGTLVGTSATCAVREVCQSDADASSTLPFQCPASYTASSCNACFAACPDGTRLDDSNCGAVQCVANCDAPAQLACGGKCYEPCAAGYKLDATNCSSVVCVPDEAACPAGATAACGLCFDCPTVGGVDYVVDASDCKSVVCRAPCDAGYSYDAGWCRLDTNRNTKYRPDTQAKYPPLTSTAATERSVTTSFPARAQPTCTAGFTLTCPGATTAAEGGADATRFQTRTGFEINRLNGSFAGPDCTDYRTPATSHFHAVAPATGHDCVDYHPGSRAPALVFSQKGNFNFTSQTGGNVQDFKPEAYRSATWQIVSSGFVNSGGSLDATSSRSGRDFATMRHKDADPAKGLVVYLSGHQYKNDFWGLRIILNTLLNLGASVEGTEIARSEPVGYKDGADGTPHVYQGTYVEVPPPTFQDWKTYDPTTPQSWRFPYTRGHLYEYDLLNISQTSQNFGDRKNWDAATKMPPPRERNIFTIVGGSANLAWKRVQWTSEQTGEDCEKAPDGKCWVSRLLASTNTAGVTPAALRAPGDDAVQAKLLGMFVQQVRGYCAAFDDVTGEPILEPTPAQCEDTRQRVQMGQKRFLGGIDHSSPAVVGKSPYVASSATRPVVAYAGARDGMLHAFYVSGTVAGLTGDDAGRELWAFLPPGQIPQLAKNTAMVDAAVNVIDVLADFPSDRNSNGVIDWQLTGETSERPTGTRTWRTVLLAAAGDGGPELFAMDVTDPLAPVLLWHVSATTDASDKWDKPAAGETYGDGAFGAGDVMDTTKPRSYALKWFDWDDGDAGTAHKPTRYDETDPAVLDLLKTGRYNYGDLGRTYGTSIGKLWVGNAYRYVAYVATTSANAGVELFAVDLVNGEKLWQWEKLYKVKTSTGAVIADDKTPPGRPALADVDADGSVDRVYVGDMEGRLWELSAHDGHNVNWFKDQADTFHSFPLFGTPPMVGTGADATSRSFATKASGGLAQQALTSPIGLGRFTDVKAEYKDALLGRLAILQGTMGMESPIAPFEKGFVHVVPVHPEAGTRLAMPDTGGTIDLSVHTSALDRGVLNPATTAADGTERKTYMSIELGVGERVYGMPRVVNNQVVFNTAFGSFYGDSLGSTVLDRGNLVIAGKDATTSTANHAKSFGGVLIFEGKVVVSTASDIHQIDATSNGLDGGDMSQRPFNRYTPAVMKTFEPIGTVSTELTPATPAN